MRRAVGAILVVLLIGALTGCEYPGVPHPLAVAAQAESRPRVAVAAAAGAVPAQPAGSQRATVLQGTVRVSQKDFKLDPDTITVKAGSITFVLKNEGRYTHDFRVEGEGFDEKGPKVGSGRSLEWRISLKPGEYRISCPVSNHADRGMVGTLTVVP
ncbi:MAG: cupredoxin domain-containing protein [Chloroflexi bacterium]|nr:cupredoxin domain-containing protein [Chloroflexota bacterium]